jgi:hypothetical protein
MFRAEARLRRWEETADVLQAAMLRLLRRLRNVTPTSPRDFFRLAAGEIRRELIDLARYYFGPWGPGTNHEAQADVPSPPGDPSDAEQCPRELAEWGEFHERVGRLPDEERRYPSAGDLADDLKRFREGKPIRGRPAGRIDRAVKWARRRPAAAVLVGVSVLALLSVAVAGGFAFFQGRIAVKALAAERTARQPGSRAGT